MALRHFADHITTETLEEVRIEIHDSEFSGTATKLKGTGSGWASRSVQKLDPREPLSNPIQKSEVTVSLWIRSSSLIDDLFSSEEGRFTLVYEKDSEEKFEGTILPDLCDYDYIEDGALWKLNIKAKDLSSLEGEYYTDDGTVNGALESGRVTIIEAIADILPFSKTIKTHTSWIVDGETSANDYLRQVYLDKFALRTYARTGDESDESLTKYQALEWILKANGLILKQDNGWVLDHITAMEDPTDVLEANYDSAGAFVSESSVDLTNTGKVVLGSKYNHNPGIKSARLKYDHRTSVSGIQFPSNVFVESANDPETYSQLIFIGDDTKISMTGNIVSIFPSEPTSPTVRIGIESPSFYWDDDDFEWKAGSGETVFDVVLLRDNLTGRTVVNIETDTIPESGLYTISLYLATPAADSSSYQDFTFNVISGAASENSTYIDYELTQTGTQSVNINYGGIYFGDGPAGYSRGAFTTDSSGDDLITDDWARRGEASFVNHAEILLREILDVQRKTRTRISATVKSVLSFGDVVSYDGDYYYILGGSYDGYTGVSKVELLEIDIQTGSDTFTDLPKFTSDEATGSAASGGGGGSGIDQSTADSRYFQQSNNLSEGNASEMRSNLGLVIGTDVQGYSSELDTYVENPLTATELGQLQNINSVTISNTQWGYLGASDQGFSKSADVEFNSLNIGTTTVIDSSRNAFFEEGTFEDDVKFSDNVDRSSINVLRNIDSLPADGENFIFTTSAAGSGFFGRFSSFGIASRNADTVSSQIGFFTGGSLSAFIDSSSNLGIGVSHSKALSYRLDVGGTGRFSGDLTAEADLFVDVDATIDRDLNVGRNAYVEGGLFAREFIVDQTRVMFDYRMSVGGGKVSTVGGSAGSEVITFEDEEGTEFVPVGEDDIIRIQERTGFNSGTIVKSLYRRVSGISGNDVTLTTSGIDWTTANDVGTIEVGDNAVVEGNTDDEDRDQFIEFDVSGQAQPSIRIKDSVTDVGVFDEVATFGYLNGVETDSFGTLGDESGVYIKSGYIDGDVDINGNLSVNSLPRVSDEGLVGLWHLDSEIDATGNNSSTLSGGSFVSGVSSKAYQTDGSAQQIVTDYVFQGGEFSVSGWFYFDDTKSVHLFGSNDLDNNARFHFGYVSGKIRTAVGNTFRDDGSLSQNEWVFLEWKSDGSTCTVYKDTVEVVSFSYTFNDGNNTEAFRIGSRDSASGNSVSGLIDELRIYETVTSESNSKSLYLYPSGNSGGLISADTVRTGILESKNLDRGSGTYTTEGTIFDLDNGDLISENFSIIDGNAVFGGSLDAVDGTFSGELSAATGSLGTLDVDGTLTIGTGGEITNSGSDYFIDDDGINIAGSSLSSGSGLRSRSLSFYRDGNPTTILADINYNDLTSPTAFNINSTTNINVTAGQYLRFFNIPTSNPGGSNRIWNDGGTLKIT